MHPGDGAPPDRARRAGSGCLAATATGSGQDRVHPGDGRHDPFGVWRFLSEGQEGLETGRLVPSIMPSLVAMLINAERPASLVHGSANHGAQQRKPIRAAATSWLM